MKTTLAAALAVILMGAIVMPTIAADKGPKPPPLGPPPKGKKSPHKLGPSPAPGHHGPTPAGPKH